MNEDIRILFVDDERNVIRSVRRLFLDEDYEIFTAGSGEKGLEILSDISPVHVVISDYKMPGMDGVEFLREVCRNWPETVRIIFSGYADTAAVVAAINEGQIYRFIPKPWKDEDLKLTVTNAIDWYSLRQKNARLNIELKRQNQELQKLNNSLEGLVEERTSELEFQNKVLLSFQNILYSLPFGIVGIDIDNFIVQCNEMGAKLFGGNSLIGTNRYDVFSQEINNFIDKVIEKGYFFQKIELNSQSFRLKGVFMEYEDSQKGIILIFDSEVSVC